MGLAPGAYQVVASLAGFEPDTVDVNVVAGTTIVADDLILGAMP